MPSLDATDQSAYLKAMAIRDIIEVPDKRLKTISTPVDAVSDETRALMDDMLETMYHANGIGLAAIQIGVPQRVIVMDIAPSSHDEGSEANSEADDEKAREDRYDLSGLEDEGPRFFCQS